MAIYFYELLMVITFIKLPEKVHSEIYTSSAEIEKLFQLESEVLRLAKLHLLEKLQNLDSIQAKLKNLTSSSNDPKEYQMSLSNPINAYHLIKTYVSDFKPYLDMMNSTESRALNVLINKAGKPMEFPTEDDLKESAKSINKIMEMYNLSISKMIRGDIFPKMKSKKKLVVSLKGEDCYEIGRQLVKSGEYGFSIPWFQEALKAQKRQRIKTLNRTEILKYLAYSFYRTEDYEGALKATEEVLLLYPNHKQMKSNAEFYKLFVGGDNDHRHVTEDPIEDDNHHIKAVFAKLCQNSSIKYHSRMRKLKCFYSTNKASLLTLQPLKIEDLHLKPRLSMVHDILSDKEVEEIKEIAFHYLQPISVSSADEVLPQGRQFHLKTSKVSWVSEGEHDVITRLKKRLELTTGMKILYHSESLQVINYGVGGYYDLHTDYIEDLPSTNYHRYFGNRLATVLFYLSDVIAGGNTVFPMLNLSITPKKGAALFWYNLYRSGNGNPLTVHGACPVLAGIKWIGNAWFTQYHQMFKRPCGMRKYDMFNK